MGCALPPLLQKWALIGFSFLVMALASEAAAAPVCNAQGACSQIISRIRQICAQAVRTGGDLPLFCGFSETVSAPLPAIMPRNVQQEPPPPDLPKPEIIKFDSARQPKTIKPVETVALKSASPPRVSPITAKISGSFRTPSGRITCSLVQSADPLLHCSLNNHGQVLKVPGECAGAAGVAFQVSRAGGKGEVNCQTIAHLPKTMDTLTMNQVWQRDGFMCLFDDKGLMCSNAAGHGFSAGDASQKMF